MARVSTAALLHRRLNRWRSQIKRMRRRRTLHDLPQACAIAVVGALRVDAAHCSTDQTIGDAVAIRRAAIVEQVTIRVLRVSHAACVDQPIRGVVRIADCATRGVRAVGGNLAQVTVVIETVIPGRWLNIHLGSLRLAGESWVGGEELTVICQLFRRPSHR